MAGELTADELAAQLDQMYEGAGRVAQTRLFSQTLKDLMTLTWFRDDYRRLGNRHAAILAAYRRCALPTMQAAAISGLGQSVFALSTFTATQRFGYLMLTILFAGMVAELIMLPALLAGPLGRFCDPRKSRQVGRTASNPPAAASPAGRDRAMPSRPPALDSPSRTSPATPAQRTMAFCDNAASGAISAVADWQRQRLRQGHELGLRSVSGTARAAGGVQSRRLATCRSRRTIFALNTRSVFLREPAAGKKFWA